MSRWLPEIRACRSVPDGVELHLRIAPDLDYFSGHFPGFPILPGVVQIDWAAKLAKQHLNLHGEFAALENLKFQAIVLPGAELRLLLALEREKGRLSFAYSAGERQFSSGRLVFTEAA